MSCTKNGKTQGAATARFENTDYFDMLQNLGGLRPRPLSRFSKTEKKSRRMTLDGRGHPFVWSGKTKFQPSAPVL